MHAVASPRSASSVTVAAAPTAPAHETAQTKDLERYTTTTYVERDVPTSTDLDASYAPAYLADYPSVVETYGVTLSGDVLLSQEKRFYDGASFVGEGGPGSGTSVAVTRGNLSCRLTLALDDTLLTAAYPTGSGASAARTARGGYLTDGTDHYIHAERYAYDTRGMVTTSRDPRGNDTTFAYDTTHGLFPTSSTDAADHPTTLARADFPHQIDSVTDANGNLTSFTYDASGLPASKSRPGASSSAEPGRAIRPPTPPRPTPTTSTACRPRSRSRPARCGWGRPTPSPAYLDGFGQTLQERHEAEPDPASPSTPRWRVTGWQIRDAKGQVIRAYQSVFGSSASYATGDTSTAFLQPTYDPLGRPTKVTYPDTTFESTTHHPWVQKAYDRNDNAGHLTGSDPNYGSFVSRFEDHLDTPTTTWLDALGRSIAIGEDNGVAAGTAPEKALRITTYEVGSGAFTGTTYTLTLGPGPGGELLRDGAGRSRLQHTRCGQLRGARHGRSVRHGRPVGDNGLR